MKNITLCLLLLLTWSARAQNFEGTIKWSMKTEPTDPALKAKMIEGQQAQQQKMNDPATQAKLAAMQAKMNDPQMKAAMEANPQVKEQFENAMKMLQGGGGGSTAMGSMVPQGMTIKMKGSDVLTKMEGGPMAIETLFLKDKNQMYRIDRQNKTYTVIDLNHAGRSASAAPPKVTKTSETAKILNYNCTKYTVELTQGSMTITQNIWTTTEIKDIDGQSLARQRMSRGGSLMYDGIEGVPLRVESAIAQGGMVMEVTEIKKESLDPAEFAIPSDFTEIAGMNRKQ